jgi:hypothetical protein
MLESISFLLNPKLYLDGKFLELKNSLNEVISSTIGTLKNNIVNNNVDNSVVETLKLLKIIQPKANISQLEDVICWMVNNTQDYTKFPVIVKKVNGNIDVNETWKSLSDWIEHLDSEKNELLLQVAAAEEALRQEEKNAAIAQAEKEAATKKAAADAALAAAAAAAQQAQAAIDAAEKLKK